MGLEKNGTVPQLQLQFKRTLQNINNEQTCVSIVLSRPAFGNPPGYNSSLAGGTEEEMWV